MKKTYKINKITAKELLEQTKVWSKISNSNITKKVLIEFAEDFAKQENESKYVEILCWLANREEIPALTIRDFIEKFK